MFYVYGVMNYINGKLYIGKTNNVSKRWVSHVRVANGGKEKYPKQFSALHSAIIKYGISNFEIFIIQQFDDELVAYQSEKYWIKYYDTQKRKLGYNIAEGGRGPGSGINSANFGLLRSESTKKKLRISHLGEKNHNFKKNFSSETRLAMSKAQKGNQAGEKNPRSILTWKLVDEIRSLYFSGVSINELSKNFHTHRSNISHIIRNKTWIRN